MPPPIPCRDWYRERLPSAPSPNPSIDDSPDVAAEVVRVGVITCGVWVGHGLVWLSTDCAGVVSVPDVFDVDADGSGAVWLPVDVEAGGGSVTLRCCCWGLAIAPDPDAAASVLPELMFASWKLSSEELLF